MKITSKGQVTIPQEIREQAGLLPGAEVKFVIRGKKVMIEKAAGGGRGQSIVKALSGKGDGGMTTDQIMALTRGEDGPGPG